MLAHKGSREGVFVAELVAGKQPHPIRYDNVPNVTYCHPEVASIGLTEDQCKEQKLEYVVGRFPLSANGRARATLETDGFVKIIRDKRYGEILGAHIVASHASELIHELAVARENEYTVDAKCKSKRPVGWQTGRPPFTFAFCSLTFAVCLAF